MTVRVYFNDVGEVVGVIVGLGDSESLYTV